MSTVDTSSSSAFQLLIETPQFRMMEEPPCSDQAHNRGCGEWPPPPIFDLPPPPRPPWIEPPCPFEDPSEGRPLTSTKEAVGHKFSSYEATCDINPLVIDSNFYIGENLFTWAIIVISSCILVGIIMVVAIVIFRRRKMFRRLYSDGSKSIASLPSLPANGQPQPHQPSFEVDANTSNHNNSSFLTTFLKSRPSEDNHMEMTDCHHVYANPSYPSMQIGGLPFYLPREQQTLEDNDKHLCVEDPNFVWQRPPRPIPRLQQQQQQPSVDNNEVVGPIYEDIDRMCSYRGYPAGVKQPPPSTSESPEYYNLTNTSGGSSPRNKSSNSEVSFEGSTTRLRTMSPATSYRSPQSVYSARLANRPNVGSSVYYYSDTLKKGRVGSDSGISVADTPPPQKPFVRAGGRPSNQGMNKPSAIVQTEVVLNATKRKKASTKV